MVRCACLVTQHELCFKNAGISLKTQELYAVVFITRYLDLFFAYVSLCALFLLTSLLLAMEDLRVTVPCWGNEHQVQAVCICHIRSCRGLLVTQLDELCHCRSYRRPLLMQTCDLPKHNTRSRLSAFSP